MTGSKIDGCIPSKFKCCGNKYTQSILFLPSRSLDTRSILWYCIISSTILWIVTSLLGKNLTWMHHLHTLSVGIQPKNEGKELIWFPMTCLFWIYFIDHQKLMNLKTHTHTQKHILTCALVRILKEIYQLNIWILYFQHILFEIWNCN